MPLSGTCTGTLTAALNAAVRVPSSSLPPSVAGSLACEAITEAGLTSSLIVTAYHEILFGGDASVARQVDREAIGEGDDVAPGGADVGGQAVVGKRLATVDQERRVEAVRVHRRHPGHPGTANHGRRAVAHQLDLLGIATGGGDLLGEERVHLGADHEGRLLADHDVDAVGGRRDLDRELRLGTGASIGLGLDHVAEVVAVDVAEQHRVDVAEARIVRAAHRTPGIVEDARAVGVLEHQRAVEPAELTVVAAERGDLDGARGQRLASGQNERGHSGHDARYGSSHGACSSHGGG